MAENRDKIDDETQTYYAEELALLDVLNELWNKQSEQAATNYFGCYEQATKAYFPNSAKKRKYSFPTYKTKRNRLLSPSWKHRKSRFPLARH